MAEEVEEARPIISQVLKLSVRLAVDGGPVDKVGRAVEILPIEYRMPSLVIEFLQLPDKLNTLCHTLLESDKDLQTTRSKTEEKSRLEAKVREDVWRGRSMIAQYEEIDCHK